MFRSARQSISILSVAVAVASASAAAPDGAGGALANDTISLPCLVNHPNDDPNAGEFVGPPAPLSQAAEPDHTDSSASTLATDQNQLDAAPMAEKFSPPASESKIIGGPGGIVSARSSANDENRSAHGILGSIDPRTNEFVRVGGALAIVIGLILVLRACVRRIGGPLAGGRRPSGVLEILARYPVGKGQQLILLKVVRRILLIHQANSTMTPLSELSDPEEVALLMARIEAGTRGKDPAAFDETLERYLSQAGQIAGRSRATPSVSPAQTIDLTRTARRGMGLFRRKGVA